MGLGAFGKPVMLDAVRQLIQPTSDGAFQLNMEVWEFRGSEAKSYSKRFDELFGPPRSPDSPIALHSPDGERFANIAASVQSVLEDVLVDLAGRLHRETGLSGLCLGGGVALNGCANARILRESGFEKVFVPPAPGDAGCALGAALWADRIFFKRPHREVPDHPFWGPVVEARELARAAREDGLSLAEGEVPAPFPTPLPHPPIQLLIA